MSRVLGITAARERLSRLVREAFLERKRILIGKHGVPMAALLPIAEYKGLLQDLEDLRDMQEAEAGYRRTGGKKFAEVIKGLRGRR